MCSEESIIIVYYCYKGLSMSLYAENKKLNMVVNSN